jgi:two-component system NtrC family sensor kinase
MTATVMVVDDSLTVRMDLVSAFETARFRCLPCASLAEARAALATSSVDVVVLDMLLPDGVGTDLLGEIRGSENSSNAAILMLSTEAEVKDRIRGLQTGADEYVGKPYDTAYVVSRARELMRRNGTQVARKPAVLVIDDSVTFRETLREALEAEGYETLVAGTGEAGLRLASDHRPGAILVDGELPGIDGPTVIRHVRIDTALRNIPCVLLTASNDRNAELRALDAGADAFVRKDHDVEVILARLAAVLRSATLSVGVESTSSLLGPKKVLAVDDSATYLHELSDALRIEGYDVVLARSGEEALEMLAVQPVDCILMDLMMPGMGGTEACRQIKSAPVVRDIPLIMLTSLEDRSAMIEGLTAGADDFISKSNDMEVLKARVRAQIRRKQFEDENRRIREELLHKELEATEARAARELAETRAEMVNELEKKNKELEAFSYSVSHDLRAPLRTIDGFSKMLLEDHADQLRGEAREYLGYVCDSAQRMNELIEGMLDLSRIGRAHIDRKSVDLSELARAVVAELRKNYPDRAPQCDIEEGLVVLADSRMMRIALDNLIGNAWKFTGKVPAARIEFRAERVNGDLVYRVRDNGSGFNMKYAEKLFTPFQRLHSEEEFSGTGIGLATVHRVIDRHGGRIWAEGHEGVGATMYFVLGAANDPVVRQPGASVPSVQGTS